MDKKKLIPVLAIVVLVAVIGYLFTAKNGVGVENTTPEEGMVVKKGAEDDGGFVGSMKEAVLKGIPMKCAISTNTDAETGDFEGYFHGEKYYAQIKTGEKTGYIVMNGKCMWTWDEDTKQGMKMCFEENVWDTEATPETGQFYTPDASYSCKPAVFSDSIFDVPADVTFMDLDDISKMLPDQE